MSTFVSIEGNIGAGKTTLLNRLASMASMPSTCWIVKQKQVIPLYEPVDAWMDLSFGKNGKNLFALFYEDMHAHAFTFQLMTLLTRIEQLQKAAVEHPGSILLCDRSYMADANVFAAMLHASGHLSDEQYGVYNRWYDNITQHGLSGIQHAGTIYLRSKPAQCLSRIAHRQRHGEVQKIELPYLDQIHTIHETWLGVGEGDCKKNHVPMLVLDVDEDSGWKSKGPSLDRLAEKAMAFIDRCTATPLPGGSRTEPSGSDPRKP